MTMTVKISGNEKHLSYARGVPGRRGGGKVGVDPEPGDPRSIFPLKLPWKVLHHRWQKQLTAWLVNVLVLIVVLAWLYLFSPDPLSLYTCIPSLCLCLWLMCTPESSQDAHRCRISGFGQKQQAAGSPRTWRPGSGTLTPGCLLHRLGPDRYIPINQSTFVALVLGLPTATEVWKISRSLGGFRQKVPTPLGGGVRDRAVCPGIPGPTWCGKFLHCPVRIFDYFLHSHAFESPKYSF